MKRRILLLTAVVMIAVMLSGCALWPFGKVTVTVETPEGVTLTGEEFDDDAFEAKKWSTVTLEARYNVEDLGELVWTADDAKVKVLAELLKESEVEEVETASADNDDDGGNDESEPTEKIVGQTITFRVRSKDLKITAKEPEVG